MGEQSAHLTLKLDTAEPVELADFVGAFTSLANEFERHISAKYPGAKVDPQIFIKEVRSGCIEADMVAGLMATAGSVMPLMDQALILEDFVKRWGHRLRALITNDVPNGELESAPELNDFLKAVQSISRDPLASHNLEAAVFEDGRRSVKAAFKFTAPEARTAEQNIGDRKKVLAKPSTEPKRRVLMVFTRTDIHDATLNKRSGERVRVADISDREYPVMYASEMAEREIREVIREADENAYKRGFVVDIMIQKIGNSIAAYAVTAFHSVIDLS